MKQIDRVLFHNLSSEAYAEGALYHIGIDLEAKVSLSVDRPVNNFNRRITNQITTRLLMGGL
jgi:hypothetical protein